MVWSPSRSSRAPSASFGFAALTLDPRSSDQGIGWLSGEAETWQARSVIPRPRGGGGGQSGIAGGEPAHAGEPPGPDDERGLLEVVVFVGPVGRCVARLGVVAAGVVAAGLAEPAEGGGVA